MYLSSYIFSIFMELNNLKAHLLLAGDFVGFKKVINF